MEGEGIPGASVLLCFPCISEGWPNGAVGSSSHSSHNAVVMLPPPFRNWLWLSQNNSGTMRGQLRVSDLLAMSDTHVHSK